MTSPFLEKLPYEIGSRNLVGCDPCSIPSQGWPKYQNAVLFGLKAVTEKCVDSCCDQLCEVSPSELNLIVDVAELRNE